MEAFAAEVLEGLAHKGALTQESHRSCIALSRICNSKTMQTLLPKTSSIRKPYFFK